MSAREKKVAPARKRRAGGKSLACKKLGGGWTGGREPERIGGGRGKGGGKGKDGKRERNAKR